LPPWISPACQRSFAVSESLQWAEGLDRKLTKAWGFYGVIIVATLIGLLLNFIGIDPIKTLVYSAVLNGVVAVPPPRENKEDRDGNIFSW
jgi:uncharacterized protein involved in cysteine biosynthesis